MNKGDLVKAKPWTDEDLEPLLKKLYYLNGSKRYQPKEKDYRKGLRVKFRTALVGDTILAYVCRADDRPKNLNWLVGWGSPRMPEIAILKGPFGYCIYPEYLLEVVFSV